MIALGHDLPRVTLVGVVAADVSLHFPDFRAGERTFQLLTQVAGRSGRGEKPGEVLIQTYNPEHPSVHMAVNQDFLAFYHQEIEQRRELDYPPFSRLVNIRLAGANQEKTRDRAMALGDTCREIMHNDTSRRFAESIEILGPGEAPREKLQGKYRWQLLLKGKDHSLLRRFVDIMVRTVLPQLERPGVTIRVDVDPVNLL
jgi:primosomal protein N' (replication factor Y)